YDDFAVVRYTAGGSLDSTFGSGGKVTTPIGDYDDEAHAVAIDGSGRIVVAGSTFNFDGNADFAVVRYNTDGSLDTSFGSGGKVTTPIGARDDEAHAVAIDGSGRIVVAGSTFSGSGFFDFAVVGYTASGSLDLTFGSGGKVTTAIGPSDDY